LPSGLRMMSLRKLPAATKTRQGLCGSATYSSATDVLKVCIKHCSNSAVSSPAMPPIAAPTGQPAA
jgi:hypothetical protein